MPAAAASRVGGTGRCSCSSGGADFGSRRRWRWSREKTGYDRFRIVITDHATGNVVFDNRLNSSMDMDVANPQNISGGSIVIHKA